MKFVALVSGGKDSCFNILHCLAQGHELVCLANLYPPNDDNKNNDDEMDSFMYQTVGHDVLTLYEKCIGVPMYRQPIIGNASNQNLEYNKTDNDETEDLFNLLTNVLKNHPDVKGVSVGAILSSYQRTRVEDVCSRLGLTSLAYLWQRDQSELMNEMCNSGMDAKIIKVAAIGLNESNLGMTLNEIQPKLIQLNQMFGVHICGEGGEFETSVFDAPFFKFGKINIIEREVIKHTNDDVWYLKMKVGFEPKEVNDEVIDWKQFIVEPPLLTERSEEIYEDIKCNEMKNKENVTADEIEDYEINWESNVFKHGDYMYVNNLSSPNGDCEEQINKVFQELEKILNDNKLEFENVSSAKLLINDMNNFTKINSQYVKYFKRALPPSRICIETKLPNNVELQLSVVILKDLKKKIGLHIQGISYWAPCNIGPYSQSIGNREDGIARISGQIPLIPKSMTLPINEDLDFKLNAILSLQHYNSIKEVINFESGLITICYIKDMRKLSIIENIFNKYKEICDDSLNDKLLVVQISELPKGSVVEWAGMNHKITDNSLNYESSDEEEEGDDNNKEKVNIRYVNNINEFTFNKGVMYEIYGNPRDINMSDIELESISYEIIPVIRTDKGSIAIVEYRI